MARISIITGKQTITDGLAGFAAVNQEVKSFDFGNVVVRKDYSAIENVRILSGGGTGNEPAYVGFVGKGMLTAAVQGNIFQSPNSKDILRTIRELSLNHLAGILVIVQGNSTTVLNFGLAVERAIKEKLRVKIVVVSDDFNNPNYLKCKRRGLCGIMLIIKLAGALAEAGYTLDKIYAACIEAEKHLCSVSVGMKHLTQTPEICLCKKAIGTNEIEIGVGINEEPGIKKLKLSETNDISQIIVRECLNIFSEKFTGEIPHPYPLVIIVNNINGLAKLEEYVFVKQLIEAFKREEIPVLRLYLGSFFSSHTLVGLIVTAMVVYDDRIVKLLDEPTKASGWVQMNQLEPITLETTIAGKLVKRMDKYVPPIKGPKLSGKESNIFTVAVQFACDALISCERQINTIDSELGDADTGTRLKNACELISDRIKGKNLNLYYPYTFFDTLSKLFEASVGGTLGCIYCILFEAAANYFGNFDEGDVVDHKMWLGALEAAATALKRYAVLESGEQTTYDPLEMCIRIVKEKLEKLEDGEKPLDAFSQGVEAAQELSQKKSFQCKYPDSGAYAVGVWMRALYEGVKIMSPDM